MIPLCRDEKERDKKFLQRREEGHVGEKKGVGGGGRQMGSKKFKLGPVDPGHQVQKGGEGFDGLLFCSWLAPPSSW